MFETEWVREGMRSEETGGTGDWGLGIGAGRRLHYKTDLFWVQYLDILSLLPGGLGTGELGDWGSNTYYLLLITYYLFLLNPSSLILHPLFSLGNIK